MALWAKYWNTYCNIPQFCKNYCILTLLLQYVLEIRNVLQLLLRYIYDIPIFIADENWFAIVVADDNIFAIVTTKL